MLMVPFCRYSRKANVVKRNHESTKKKITPRAPNPNREHADGPQSMRRQIAQVAPRLIMIHHDRQGCDCPAAIERRDPIRFGASWSHDKHSEIVRLFRRGGNVV